MKWLFYNNKIMNYNWKMKLRIRISINIKVNIYKNLKFHSHKLIMINQIIN